MILLRVYVITVRQFLHTAHTVTMEIACNAAKNDYVMDYNVGTYWYRQTWDSNMRQIKVNASIHKYEICSRFYCYI
jgi:hypothetical protein